MAARINSDMVMSVPPGRLRVELAERPDDGVDQVDGLSDVEGQVEPHPVANPDAGSELVAHRGCGRRNGLDLVVCGYVHHATSSVMPRATSMASRIPCASSAASSSER